MKHLRYDLIVRAAADTTLTIWYWFEGGTDNKNWSPTTPAHLWSANTNVHFSIGDKPTSPPSLNPTMSQEAAPNEHQNRLLIELVIKDMSLPIWRWYTLNEEWARSSLEDLITARKATFSVGPKPTEPPKRMCELAGVKFPEPMKVAPAIGTIYWCAGAYNSGVRGGNWTNHLLDQQRLKARVLHDNEPAALAQSAALQAANLAVVESSN